MRIALIAHDSRKELMAQFCTAYVRILSEHDLVATGVTGKIVHDATGLPVRCLYPGGRGGAEQISAMIGCGEVDMLLFFRNPVGAKPGEPNDVTLLRLCDMHTIPVATNIATAEVLIHGLERGDLAWIELQRGREFSCKNSTLPCDKGRVFFVWPVAGRFYRWNAGRATPRLHPPGEGGPAGPDEGAASRRPLSGTLAGGQCPPLRHWLTGTQSRS